MKKENSYNPFQAVTDMFVQALQEDVIPWRPQYRLTKDNTLEFDFYSDFRQYNGFTLNPYRSLNTLSLELAKLKYGFEHPLWLTFVQAKDLGLKVTGKSKVSVYYRDNLYFRKIDGKKVKIKEGEYYQLKRKGVDTLSIVPFLKSKSVFNIAQTEGDYEIPNFDSPVLPGEGNPNACHQLLKEYSYMPTILHGTPAYDLISDVIFMPDRNEYFNDDAFYHSLFHEVIHSTGHQDRLNRDGIARFDAFGTPRYAREELIGEIGASFLSAHTKTFAPVIDNAKGYIQDWISKLQRDPKLIYWAAGQAQKAFDYVLTQKSEGAAHQSAALCA